MKVKVYYPSGTNKVITGKFLGCFMDRGVLMTVGFELTEACRIGTRCLQSGDVLVIDPRAVCFDLENEKVIYNGRDHYAALPKEMRKFMDDNPQWPDLLELGKTMK